MFIELKNKNIVIIIKTCNKLISLKKLIQGFQKLKKKFKSKIKKIKI